MPQCIVLNVTESGEWIDQVNPHPKGIRAQGLHIPKSDRPALIHPTREAAEKEAAELAATTVDGWFAVFELVGVVMGARPPSNQYIPGMGSYHIKQIPHWQEDPPKF